MPYEISDEKWKTLKTQHLSGVYTLGSLAEIYALVNAAVNDALSSQWVSVTDMLPKFDTPVLALIGGQVYAMERSWFEEGWMWGQCVDMPITGPHADYEADDDYEVTHWMPIPALPSSE